MAEQLIELLAATVVVFFVFAGMALLSDIALAAAERAKKDKS
jgi:hypothetical protein